MSRFLETLQVEAATDIATGLILLTGINKSNSSGMKKMQMKTEKRSKQNLGSTRNNTIELNLLGEYKHSKIATSKRQKIITKKEMHLFSIRSKLMFKLCSLNQVTDG